jgi:hypothetical protein
MAVPWLPVGERVELLADCGERDVVEEEPRGRPVCSCSWHSQPGQVVIAVRLTALPDALTHMT